MARLGPSLLVAACLAIAPAFGAVAQEGDGPPDTLPPGSSLSTTSVAFNAVSTGFTAGSVQYTTGQVTFTGARIEAPGGAVDQSASGVAANEDMVRKGMSVRQEQGGALRFTLNADLLFDFDKANLRPTADEVLTNLVMQVDQRIPNGRFRIEGHTDAKGTDRYNDQLSLRRAKSVEAWLKTRARVAQKRIATAGLGKRRPVAPNARPDGSDDPEGRQKNRRVEILALPPG